MFLMLNFYTIIIIKIVTINFCQSGAFFRLRIRWLISNQMIQWLTIVKVDWWLIYKKFKYIFFSKFVSVKNKFCLNITIYVKTYLFAILIYCKICRRFHWRRRWWWSFETHGKKTSHWPNCPTTKLYCKWLTLYM